MDISLQQSYIFMATVYGGIVAGVLYDVYRMLRRILHAGRIVTALFDALFVLCALGVVVAVLYTVNSGELRAYSFLGFAIGFFIYIIGISCFLRFIIQKAYGKIKKRRGGEKAEQTNIAKR